MSIVDVDKSSSDRSSPMPNVEDKHLQRVAHGTTSVNYQTPMTNQTTTAALQSGLFRLVFSNTIKIINDGSTLTTFTDTHGLGYVPMALAALNNSSVVSADGTVTGASVFLPTFTSANIGGVTAGVVTFSTWLYYFVDTQKIYIQMLNAGGSPVTEKVTYYLYQQQATGTVSS